ncbi:hypothetical protein H7992_04945 [Sporosarcina sp. resist]|uniref:hypothetical protein n=1 Tax=Sporosarcina sp. resist TaxID=2762563 RepID=UPI00164D8334|nr:hypothetical protein [Sporosarcina sp. resist]QNK89075.1 hypothetical protein H7992_04945 [Sporosarcina sp. resist]
MLFLFRESESESEKPDWCIAYYDELSPKEKSDVELIVARYFSMYYRNETNRCKIEYLIYEE